MPQLTGDQIIALAGVFSGLVSSLASSFVISRSSIRRLDREERARRTDRLRVLYADFYATSVQGFAGNFPRVPEKLSHVVGEIRLLAPEDVCIAADEVIAEFKNKDVPTAAAKVKEFAHAARAHLEERQS